MELNESATESFASTETPNHENQQQQQANHYQTPMCPKEVDCVSIRSSNIYSTCRTTSRVPLVRSSRSVFSIYEDTSRPADDSASSSSSASSSVLSSATCQQQQQQQPPSQLPQRSTPTLERLSEFELHRIESMYRSIGSLVCVAASTCHLFTTTSEQIAHLLHDCWRLQAASTVPLWLLDTGYNPKRERQLRLMFVDRRTAFPLMRQPIVIRARDQLRCPNGDQRRLTFTLQNKQLVCLIEFGDFLACHDFFKFYQDLLHNPR